MRRFLLWLILLVVGLPLLALGLFGADVLLNGHRLADRLLGRDALVAACHPALAQQLGEAGFQPQDLEIDPDAALGLSSALGRSLEGGFTFQDGALQQRVDGILACVQRGGVVTVRMRTRSLPVRAT